MNMRLKIRTAKAMLNPRDAQLRRDDLCGLFPNGQGYRVCVASDIRRTDGKICTKSQNVSSTGGLP